MSEESEDISISASIDYDGSLLIHVETEGFYIKGRIGVKAFHDLVLQGAIVYDERKKIDAVLDEIE